jgi:hypothetical protein
VRNVFFVVLLLNPDPGEGPKDVIPASIFSSSLPFLVHKFVSYFITNLTNIFVIISKR